jgi:hypothetical protein
MPTMPYVLRSSLTTLTIFQASRRLPALFYIPTFVASEEYLTEVYSMQERPEK